MQPFWPRAFPYQELRSPQSLCWTYHLIQDYLSLFRLSVHSFVLLKGVSHMAPGQPTSAGRGWGLYAAAQERCVQANSPASPTERAPLTMGDQSPLLKLILLSPLYGSKVLFHPYCVYYVVFSLATLKPRCCRSVQTSTLGARQEMLLAQHTSFMYFMYVISLNPQNIPVSGRTRIRIHR